MSNRTASTGTVAARGLTKPPLVEAMARAVGGREIAAASVRVRALVLEGCCGVEDSGGRGRQAEGGGIWESGRGAVARLIARTDGQSFGSDDPIDRSIPDLLGCWLSSSFAAPLSPPPPLFVLFAACTWGARRGGGGPHDEYIMAKRQAENNVVATNVMLANENDFSCLVGRDIGWS